MGQGYRSRERWDVLRLKTASLIEVATRINKKSVDTPFGTYEFHQLQEDL